MCNLAGYIGEKAAAPILVDMIKRQEGFAGGYYTGIATVYESRIYYVKVKGDIKKLLSVTDALNLPGNAGIIHSRSNGGGGDLFAHPFEGKRGGRVTEVYMANGSMGSFAVSDDEYNDIIKSLLKEGYTFTSGEKPHMSDVMCQLIVRNIHKGLTPDKAIEKAFCTMPNEIAGLMLSLEDTESIFYGRINRPIMISFGSHGAYISTSALAFPNDRGEVFPLPVNSSGYIKKDSFHTSPFKKPPVTVSEIDGLFEKGVEILREELKEGRKNFRQLVKFIKPLFGGNCGQEDLLCYEALRTLCESGEIIMEDDKSFKENNNGSYKI